MNLSANVTGFGGLERLPEYQNIITSFDRFLSYGGQLGYQNLRASLGAVDFEKGYRWQLISSNTYVRRKHFPKVVLNIDLGVPLPIHHSSVWLHASAGYAHGGRIQPLANFYFGGFGNNWIDHQAVKRYRVYHSFPGAEINAIAGTNFVRAVTEWNLPPVRFRRLGFPWFFVTWARPSVFASGIITNLEESEEQLKAGNLGSQLDIRMVMLSHLKFTLSFGYAVYSPEAQRGADEFMVSLKVL